MYLTQTQLFGINITTQSQKDMIEYCQKYLQQGNHILEPLMIVTPNPEIIIQAQKLPDLKQTLNSSQIVLPDGIGIVWAIKLFDVKNKLMRVTGIDFMQKLIEVAVKQEYPVALIGSRNGRASKTLQHLRLKFPKLKGWAWDGPELKIKNSEFKIQNDENTQYFTELLGKIRETEIRMVCIGLGVPKQEWFMKQLRNLLIKHSSLRQPIILMTVGGAFDILSGDVPRAPMIFQMTHLEWWWRLLLEPWRIGRQLRLIHFLLLTLYTRYVLQSR